MSEIKNLFQKQSIELATDYFLKTLKGSYLYFKWMESENALKLERSNPATRVAPSRPKILRLYESHPQFKIEDLQTPEKISFLNQFVQKITGQTNMKSRLISIGENPYAVLFAENLNSNLADCFENHCSLLFWKKRCISLSSQDYFLKILYKEISRARRLLHPVSLVVIRGACSENSSFDKNLFFKSLMNHLQKNNRLYDTLVQISEDEIACILPHTSEKAAIQKAGQIQGLLKSLNQKNILKGFCQIGVATYPRVGRDAVNLLHLAREACHSGDGENICVAQTPVSFKPDFLVQMDSASLSELV